jgi:integrase
LEAARTAALTHAAKVAQGADPAAEIRQKRIAERAFVRTALDDFAIDLARRRIVKRDMAISALRRGFAPVLDLEISSLDLRKIVALVESIAATKRTRKNGTSYFAVGAAGEFRRLAHSFLQWAVSRGLVPFNVLAGYRAPRLSREEALAREARKGRALDDDEIVKVWTATGGAGAFGALLRLGLLTALRRNELAGLRWADVKDDRIVIPARRAKMGREHAVPLTGMMKTVLASSPRSTSDLVFPSLKSGGELAGWSKMLPRLVSVAGVKFRLHDLRRTCRTLMSQCGIDETTSELAIGHVRRGLVGTYNKDDAWPARQAAFENVSSHVALVLAHAQTETVIQFTADRRLAP